MAFKKDNKKLKNIILVVMLIGIAIAYFYIESLPQTVPMQTTTKGYELNVKF